MHQASVGSVCPCC